MESGLEARLGCFDPSGALSPAALAMVELLTKAGPLLTSIGSLVVAVLVMAFNKRQSGWQNQVSARAAEMEDQKLRLALLDRRQRSTEKLREVILSIKPDGSNVSEAVNQLSAVLREASLVFITDDRAEIERLLASVAQFAMDVRMARQSPGSGRRLPNGMDPMIQHGTNQIRYMTDQLNALVDRLTESSRIEPVNRLVPPPPLWRRIWRATGERVKRIAG